LADKTFHTPNPSEHPKKDQVSEVRYIPLEYLQKMDDDEGDIFPGMINTNVVLLKRRLRVSPGY
jgi:hypothetical protein